MPASNFNAKLFNSLKQYSKTHNLGWDRFNQQLTPDELLRNIRLSIDPTKVNDAADGPGAVLFALQWSIETGRIPIATLQTLAKSNGAYIGKMFDTVLAKSQGRSQRELLEHIYAFNDRPVKLAAPKLRRTKL